MVKVAVEYTGEKHCELRHGPSGSHIQTDAPLDNHGKGEAFSPTDLVAAALGSCILTTIALVAERDGLNVQGSRADVEKHMQASPRMIAQLLVKVTLPAHLTSDERAKLERTARACPVHKSLHPDVKLPISFAYE